MGTKKLLTVGLLFSIVLSYSKAAPAAEEGDSRREQLRQEAQASYVQISQALDILFKKVSLNQRPSAIEIEAAATVLETNKRNAVAYDSVQKAGYMLLQSWTSYYQNEHVNALNWAVRACREDTTNGDAWVTQTLFSYLYGKRPAEPQGLRQQRSQNETRDTAREERVPRRTRPQPQPRVRQNESQMMAPAEPVFDPTNPYGRPGKLGIDIRTLNKDFYRERFIRQEYLTTDRKKIVYTPGQDILCVLFWQGEEVVDPNAPGGKALTPQAVQGGMENFFAEPMMQQTHSLKDQQGYFEFIMKASADKKDIKFVEINTNTPAGYEKALKDHTPVCPLVAAGSAQSGAAPFVRLDAKKPFMAIIDKEGQVKYAGPAGGFAPAFVLTHLTGAAIDLQAYQTAHPATAPMGMPPGMSELMLFDPMMPPPVMPQSITPADPNRPLPVDPNQPRPLTGVKPEKKPRELPFEQQITAEQKMNVARELYKPLAQKRGLTPKKLVDTCREVIRDYPGTRYADEALEMLRTLPERDRTTYHITNEELGL